MHNKTKRNIIMSIIGILISIVLIIVFFAVGARTEQILPRSSEYSVLVFSFVFGSLIGFVSITALFSSIKTKKDPFKKNS